MSKQIEKNELFEVRPHPGESGFEMMLRGGGVDVPDIGGCYVISTGCGSGKTESIKSLIRQRYNQGIVYCVDTKAELQKMYSWILSNLCNRPGTNLTENDVLMLCSTTDEDTADQRAIKDAMVNQYLDNPWCLLNKKILLLTHVRFWTDLINFFLIYRPDNPNEVGAFDGNFEHLMQRQDLRGYILFDETPTFIKPFASFPRPLLGLFSEQDNNGKWHCKDEDSIRASYDTFLRNSKMDLFKQTYTVNRIKKDVVLNVLPRYYDQWRGSNNDIIELTFTPADLSQPIVNTHVIIFEGAGDVLLGGAERYQLLDIADKYHVNVEFCPFNWSLYRRKKEKQDVNGELDAVAKVLNGLSGNTLVVVWKNIGADLTDDCLFYEQAKLHLEAQVSKPFHITYYGAADTKSTNDYRNYQNVILCGGWSIPENDTAKFRSHYMTETSNEMHRLWYFVQLLSRIGIRRSDGGHYLVYYSTDFKQSFITRLSDYFNNNICPVLIQDKNEYWREKIKAAKIRKEIVSRIEKLSHKYPGLTAMIECEGGQQKFVITLDEIFNITPTGKTKETRKYAPLKKALMLLGIDLIIKK